MFDYMTCYTGFCQVSKLSYVEDLCIYLVMILNNKLWHRHVGQYHTDRQILSAPF